MVSVIIPAYNVEKYIGECLDSIIFQTYKNIEIIVVNDGSKDNTLSIIRDYSKKDNRIIIIDKQNTGVSDTRNCGINKAKGVYIVFVDGDDYLANDYITYMLSLIDKND
ncbi:MAG: glycosyltransferase family 2 protein, partial [Candidatus Riflebacteria bacterium]|nr:glycosyltransferase family 2 protein [Candidatus Riflebacteria bacterium]